MTTGPSGDAGTGPPRIAERIVDFLLDAFVAVFKAIPRGARR